MLITANTTPEEVRLLERRLTAMLDTPIEGRPLDRPLHIEELRLLFAIRRLLHTITRITDDQIRDLRHESSAAGDLAMERLCSVALGEVLGAISEDDARAEARAVCARVIVAGQG
jgi:hypothetical protein